MRALPGDSPNLDATSPRDGIDRIFHKEWSTPTHTPMRNLRAAIGSFERPGGVCVTAPANYIHPNLELVTNRIPTRGDSVYWCWRPDATNVQPDLAALLYF